MRKLIERQVSPPYISSLDKNIFYRDMNYNDRLYTIVKGGIIASEHLGDADVNHIHRVSILYVAVVRAPKMKSPNGESDLGAFEVYWGDSMLLPTPEDVLYKGSRLWDEGYARMLFPQMKHYRFA